jgi:ABC-type molybdate transport system substrate-binding protein
MVKTMLPVSPAIMRTVIKAIFLFLLTAAATAAEIKVLSTTAVQEVAEIIGAKFQKSSGHRVIFVFEPIGNMRKRMTDGETGDIFSA